MSFMTIDAFFSALEYTSIEGNTYISPLPERVIPMTRLLTGDVSMYNLSLILETIVPPYPGKLSFFSGISKNCALISSSVVQRSLPF